MICLRSAASLAMGSVVLLLVGCAGSQRPVQTDVDLQSPPQSFVDVADGSDMIPLAPDQLFDVRGRARVPAPAGQVPRLLLPGTHIALHDSAVPAPSASDGSGAADPSASGDESSVMESSVGESSVGESSVGESSVGESSAGESSSDPASAVVSELLDGVRFVPCPPYEPVDHVAVAGDSWWLYSDRTGLSYLELGLLNGVPYEDVKSGLLHVGHRVVLVHLPDGAEPPDPALCSAHSD